MIFPILNGILSFSKTPVTWILVFLNVFVMMLTSVSGEADRQVFSELLKDKAFMEIQGSIYRFYLRGQPRPLVKRELASLAKEENTQSDMALAVLAFKDQKFLESQESDVRYTDEVAFSYWKKNINQLLTKQATSVNQLLGVSVSNFSWPAWLSYMFAHGGWVHLLGNMIFLVLIGGTLELSLGGLGVLIVYLFSGFIAGGTYILLSGLGASPMVGASGAVSGLITLLAVLNWNRPVRFAYWLLIPHRKTLGFIYLPGAFVFYLWVLADLAGYLSATEVTGGVAHSAHLGGHLAGALAGLSLLLVSRFSGRPESQASTKEMYQLEPMILFHRL